MKKEEYLPANRKCLHQHNKHPIIYEDSACLGCDHSELDTVLSTHICQFVSRRLMLIERKRILESDVSRKTIRQYQALTR